MLGQSHTNIFIFIINTLVKPGVSAPLSWSQKQIPPDLFSSLLQVNKHVAVGRWTHKPSTRETHCDVFQSENRASVPEPEPCLGSTAHYEAENS